MKNKKVFILPLLVVFAVMAITFSVKAATITKLPIEMIFATPGEDASTEVGISWHATFSSSTIVYTTEDDLSFNRAISITLDGTKSDVNYYEKSSLGTYYLYSVDLEGLDADTRYIYRIKAGSNVSKPHYFKTAGYGGTFNFVMMSDVHARNDDQNAIWSTDGVESGALKQVVLKAEELTKDNGGIDFVCFDGDFVRYGAVYKNWQLYNDSYLTTNYSFAFTMGNHEYYDASHNGTNDQTWTQAMINAPDNSTTGRSYDYWYIYNSILFIAFDNIHGDTQALRDWLESVLEEQKGNYQYCIAYHHHPDFTTSCSTGVACDYGSYDLYDIWDKYGVDAVISADSHVYVRTKPLYNNSVYTGTENKGTIYFTTSNIHSSTTSLATTSNQWYSKVGSGGGTSAMLFNVTPQGMKMTLFSPSKDSIDTYTFTPRNEFKVREELTDSVEESLQYINIDSDDTGYVVGSNAIASVVSNIKIYNGTTLIGEENPIQTKNSAVKVSMLASNSVYDLTAVITYSDSTEKQVQFKANTNSFSGFATAFKAGISEGMVKLTWEEVDLSSLVNEIKLYRNDELLTTLAKGVKQYSFIKTDADLDATYHLELVSSDGTVLNVYNCFYIAYGDFNSDGVVSVEDMNEICKATFEGELNKRQLNTADIDHSGKADYKDLMLIYDHIKNGTSLASDEYTVTFKNIDGTIIKKEIVKYGESATLPSAPTLEGYSFKCWSDDSSYVTKNIEIFAIYTK